MEDIILYKYTCLECDVEYVTNDPHLKYCNSDKCVDKDQLLSSPRIFED